MSLNIYSFVCACVCVCVCVCACARACVCPICGNVHIKDPLRVSSLIASHALPANWLPIADDEKI